MKIFIVLHKKWKIKNMKKIVEKMRLKHSHILFLLERKNHEDLDTLFDLGDKTARTASSKTLNK